MEPSAPIADATFSDSKESCAPEQGRRRLADDCQSGLQRYLLAMVPGHDRYRAVRCSDLYAGDYTARDPLTLFVRAL